MIYLRLTGGLGNQLFQFALAYKISINNKCDLHIDISALGKYSTKRELNIFDIFEVPSNVFIKNSFNLVNRFRIGKLIGFYSPFVSFINDKNVHKLDLTSTIRGDFIFVDGYFLEAIDQKQFSLICDSVFKLLKLTDEIQTQNETNVSIHIRGGDFLNLKDYHVCDLAYYKNSIEYFRRKYGVTIFNVVTDDKSYASDLLGDFGVELNFVGGGWFEDFSELARSKYLIGSNSTFCFWAAALGQHVSKGRNKVIFPSQWRLSTHREIKLDGEVF